jgi:hypothetical protein
MMSEFVVPSWNLRHERQEQVEGEEGNRSSHVHNEQNHPPSAAPLVHMYTLSSFFLSFFFFVCIYLFFLSGYGV